MKLRAAAAAMGAEIDMVSAALLDAEFAGVGIDSRAISPDQLFFALAPDEYGRNGFNGTFADGHDYMPQAFAAGALAAVARRSRVSADSELAPFAQRCLFVDDAIAGLQTLAQSVCAQWTGKVIGITGSAGKTTAKELAACVLEQSGRRVLRNEKNYNNGLGLPLTILRMIKRGDDPENYDTAVLEMGMSSPMHEIRTLCRIAPPHIGVELLVAPVHLEHLGSIENIAAAKAELIEGLKPTGIAILNADDERVLAMRTLHNGQVMTFGIQNRADVMATHITVGQFGHSQFTLHTPLGTASVQLALAGRHNISNALAAAAVATCFAIGPQEIARSFSTVMPGDKRGEILTFVAGFGVIDDSYNSNPKSLVSMAHTLVEGGKHARRLIVVAGEMLELGTTGPELHHAAGREIAAAGVQVVWGVRGLAQDLVAGARAGGLSDSDARFFENTAAAAGAIGDLIKPGDLILVKGSRGVRTDLIVKQLCGQFELLSGK